MTNTNTFTNRDQVLEVANQFPQWFDDSLVWDSNEVSNEVTVDDGFLHVNLGGVHVAFQLQDNATRSHLNSAGRQLARAFGLNFDASRFL